MTLRLAPEDIVAQSTSPLLTIANWWERCRLDDIAAVTNGAAFKSARFNTLGDGLPLIRIRDVGQLKASTYYSGGYEDRHVVESGDLLIGMDGDFRIARWTGGQALLNQRVCRLQVRDSDLYCDRFLEYVLQPYLDEIHKVTSSVTVKHLSSRTVADLPIPLPPRAEQERIAAAIEEHFLRIDAVQTALCAARTRLDALQRSAAATLFDRPGWTWTTLGEIAALKGGITKDSKREADPDFVEYPYLRVANVQRGFLDLTEVTAVRADPYKAANLVLLPGDMLFNEGGDRDKLGRGWVWEGQIENCIHQNHVFRARLTDDRFDPYFISMHANTWGQRWFDTHGKQTTNLASISLATLKSFPVPAPPPDEQRAVVDELQSIMRSEDRLRADLDRVERRSKTMRRAVLSRAFSGQLVPQASNDEPVSVLMERIAAHRAAERAYGGLRCSRVIPDKGVSPE